MFQAGRGSNCILFKDRYCRKQTLRDEWTRRKGTEELKINHIGFATPRIIASRWRMTVSDNRLKSVMAPSWVRWIAGGRERETDNLINF